MVVDPFRKLVISDSSRRGGEDQRVTVAVRRGEFRTVEIEKEFENHQPHPLVAIHKRMILDDSKSVRSGKHGDAGLRISRRGNLLRSCESRLQEPLIPDPKRAAILRRIRSQP